MLSASPSSSGLSDPGDLSVTEFASEIESDRCAMDGFLSRVEKLDTPGDMSSAQDSLTLVYQLRAGAMGEIADRMSTALGDEGSGAGPSVRSPARWKSSALPTCSTTG